MILVNETHCVEDCGGNGCTTTDYSEFDNLKEKQRYGEIEEEKEVNHVLIDTKTGDVKNLKCPIGYYYNKETEVCEDIDECVTSLHNCEFDRECRNTVGAFVCEECEEGA
ncbi:fibulin-7-like protein, partial [Leptotrombidium deliense]